MLWSPPSTSVYVFSFLCGLQHVSRKLTQRSRSHVWLSFSLLSRSQFQSLLATEGHESDPVAPAALDRIRVLGVMVRWEGAGCGVQKDNEYLCSGIWLAGETHTPTHCPERDPGYESLQGGQTDRQTDRQGWLWVASWAQASNCATLTCSCSYYGSDQWACKDQLHGLLHCSGPQPRPGNVPSEALNSA